MRFLTATFFILLLSACSENNQDSERENLLSLIEVKLSLPIEEDMDMATRLEKIDSVLAEKQAVSKHAFIAYKADTIAIGSTYKAAMVLAYHRPKSPPIAILKSNNGIDTIAFNPRFDCFVIDIPQALGGENVFQGEIIEDGNSFPFGGSFFGR
jgi:hypothetical protein